MLKSLLLIFKDIKIQHTVFAMPFAVIAAFAASDGFPDPDKIFWIIVALIFARSSAMAFNRLVDRGYDSENPRTNQRPLAAKTVDKTRYILFISVSSILFILSAYMLNPVSFLLSPAALLICFAYSFTKRFTHMSHFFLGISLSLAPIGSWVAIEGSLSLFPVILGISVVFWLAGLDIIYSCQDVEFDKDKALFSIPSRFGVKKALKLSSLFHIIMVVLLFFLIPVGRLGWLYIVGLILSVLLLTYEHSILDSSDLSRVNTAFFHTNGMLSIMLMSFTIADYIVR